MKTKLLLLLTLVMLALISTLNLQLSTCHASPLGTAFTYQGQLNDGGSPANGIYDLRFTIYDAGEGGSAVTGILTNAPVAVTNGLFTTLLDFGSDVFVGEARWLEIGVRSNGAGGFTILSPRQILRPIPYALFAMNANLTGTYSDVVAFTNLGNIFNGEGGGLDNLNAAKITAGTLNDARLSTNVALLNNSTNRFSGKMIVNNALIVTSNLTSKGNIRADGDPASGHGLIFAANLHATNGIFAGGDLNVFGDIFGSGSLTLLHDFSTNGTGFSTNGTSAWAIESAFTFSYPPAKVKRLLYFFDEARNLQMHLENGPQGGVVANNLASQHKLSLGNVPWTFETGDFSSPQGSVEDALLISGAGVPYLLAANNEYGSMVVSLADSFSSFGQLAVRGGIDIQDTNGNNVLNLSDSGTIEANGDITSHEGFTVGPGSHWHIMVGTDVGDGWSVPNSLLFVYDGVTCWSVWPPGASPLSAALTDDKTTASASQTAVVNQQAIATTNSTPPPTALQRLNQKIRTQDLTILHLTQRVEELETLIQRISEAKKGGSP